MNTKCRIKLICWIASMAFLLAACGVQPGQPPVENTRTAALNSAPKMITQTVTNTPLPPSATPSPTRTPRPTPTPRLTPTSAPQPVMTTIFTDTFDLNEHPWKLSKSMKIEDGKLVMTASSEATNYLLLPLESRRQFDVTVKVDLQLPAWDKKQGPVFGVACRLNEVSGDQYLLAVAPIDETHLLAYIMEFKDGNLAQDVKFREFELQESILEEAVRLQFSCQGSNLMILSGNKILVHESDSGLKSGSLAFVLVDESGDASVALDDLEVVRINTGEPSPETNLEGAQDQDLPLSFGGGGMIAFTSNRDGNNQIYLMNANGSGQARLAPSQDDEFFPSFSSDGKIAFFLRREYQVGPADLYALVTGEPGSKMLVKSVYGRASSSPDGSQIAFSAGTTVEDMQIYIANADGNGKRRLTNNPGTDLFPSWSPDGETIAFTNGSEVGCTIYLIDVNGKNLRSLGVCGFRLAWSPDGSQIAFQLGDDENTNIFVVYPTGKGLRQVTFLEGYNEDPTWSPDGNYIAFWSDHTGNREIFAISVHGTGLVNLTNNPYDDEEPYWSR